MKTVTLSVSALLLALVFSAGAQTKIVTIDLRKVFDDYYKTKAADANLKDRAGDLDKERKGMVEQYQKATEDYKKSLDDANNQAVSADEREKRKKTAEGKLLEIKELEQNIKTFDSQARSNLEEQQRRMRDKILGEIRMSIDAIAKTRACNLVVDTAAESFNKTPVVLYNTGENDITDAVLSQLNSTAPPGTLKPAEKKEEKKK